MTKIIALFNQAGGVAKSTTAQNLGYHLADRQHRVLLVDLDPQASLTSFMGLEPDQQKVTIYNALIPPEDEDDQPLPIVPHLHQMDFVPANLLLANAEQELIFAELRELRLRNLLAPIAANYDFILIDCPPSLGLLSQIALVAASHILVPVQCQFKALIGTDSLLSTIARVRKRLNPALRIAGFVPTMYQVTNSLDKRTLEALEEQLSGVATIFPPMPRATAIAEATEYGLPLALAPTTHKILLQQFAHLAQAMEAL